jgi:hypothetical protein
VLALDAVAPLAAAAAARGARLSRVSSANQDVWCAACSRRRQPVPPVAVTACFPWGGPASGEALHALLRQALPPDDSSSTGGSEGAPRSLPRVVLVGLHACGDLTPSLLRTFACADAAVAVVVVGCCYNLLTEAQPRNGSGGERAAAFTILRDTAAAAARRRRAAGDAPQPGSGWASPPLPDDDVDGAHACAPGFPLSAAAAALKLRLGRGARMLACQSGDRWRTAAGAPSDANTQRQCFRAAMDVVLRRFFPDAAADTLCVSRGRNDDGGGACGRKADDAAQDNDADGAAFARAARASLAAAGLCVERAPEPTLAALWRDELAPFAPLLGAFCALRAVLTGPLESALLLDRLLYLREALRAAGGDDDADAAALAQVVPLFDPARSPRNVALVARKPMPAARA